MTTSEPSAEPAIESGAGRPRDPEMESKALAAALEVFGRYGWSGFTIGAVAEQAHIGKSSIYLRWPSKEELLLAAFDKFDAFFERVNDDEPLPLLERMRRIVQHRTTVYFSQAGLAVIRLNVEYQATPDSFGPLWQQTIGRAIVRQRKRLETAKAAGELSPETSVTHLAEALEGAMLMHVLATPAELRDATLAQLPEFVEMLVARSLDPWLTDVGRGFSAR